jgi:hypothetical protein
MTARLAAVPTPVEQPAPDLSYEWQDRQRIAARDWARVHIAGDRAPVLAFLERVKRTWRR